MQQQYSGSILQMEDVTVQVGDDVTFYCFHPKDQMNRVMWFKQTLGEKPALVASSYHWSQDSVVHDEFKKSKRFKVNSGLDSFNLTIERTVQSDSATYYCAGSFSNLVYFGVGTNLVLRGSKSNRIHILQQSGTTSSDGNVTLQCTIQNEQQSCEGEHRVYWFRQESRKSSPGIIYAQESCKNSSVTASPTRSCVYNLSMRNINPGTYYCAVVTCGEILFGHGINLDIDDEHKGQHVQFYILIGLAALLIINFITNVLLCVTKTKGNTSQQVHATDNIQSSAQYHGTSDMNYAALKFKTQNSRQQKVGRQRQTEYSGLKLNDSVP
ncbi:immunoglobulin kappa light chain-like [Chanodichthys erythropterus]|uniref:immunoglobulin kappa light chain-like n=1 Tax=Chanodichthys erythropterus TaxID=933992 RepID=UPI00351E26C3